MTKKSEKSKESTALAVVGTSVPDVLSILNEKLKALKTVTECAYKTNGQLAGFGDIKAETKVENLIRAYSSVRGRENAYNEAAKELGLTSFPVFNESGGTAADWKQDILLRKAVIEHADTQKKLQDLTDKAKSFLTQADQYQIFLQEAGAMVGELGLTK